MNVTYGYAGASFSGRMPCGDIADSIVGTSRFMLEQITEYINNHKEWRAKVVYGDTDSVFVHLKGRSINEAIDLGKTMADEITGLYPYPITLKYEKLYYPLILASKKRYIGYKIENKNDKVSIIYIILLHIYLIIFINSRCLKAKE